MMMTQLLSNNGLVIFLVNLTIRSITNVFLQFLSDERVIKKTVQVYFR